MGSPITPTLIRTLRKVRRDQDFHGPEYPAYRRAVVLELAFTTHTKPDIGDVTVERHLTLAGELVLAAWDEAERLARSEWTLERELRGALPGGRRG